MIDIPRSSPGIDIRDYLPSAAVDPRSAPYKVLVFGSSKMRPWIAAIEQTLSFQLRRKVRVAFLNLAYLMSFAYPRGLPFEALPMSSDPWTQYRAVSDDKNITSRPVSGQVELSTILDEFDAYAVDGEYDPEAVHYFRLFSAGHTLKIFGVDDRPVFARTTTAQTEIHRPFVRTSADELLAKERVYARFLYNYALNTSGPLLDALRRYTSPADHEKFRRFNIRPTEVQRTLRELDGGDIPGPFCHPLSIQGLYAVDRHGGIPVIENTIGELGSPLQFLISAGPLETWPGTGRYKPLLLPEGEIVNALNGLVHLGFLDIGDRVTVSASGRALLDAMGPDFHDEDVYSRWTDGGAPFATATERDADEWIMSKFSKLNARLLS
jgi:hypothetical protein